MRKTRFMSMLFLALSGAFFCVPEFRQALHVPAFTLGQFAWLERAGKLSPQTLQELERPAEQQRDASTLAFVALNQEDERRRMQLADRASALDPKLTWVYWNPGPQKGRDPKLEDQKIARLKAWDPDNAVPYLIEGERIFETRNLPQQLGTLPSQDRQKLLEEAAWRQAMAKAFAAPRYDAYTIRRFELVQSVLRRHGLDTPATVLWSLASFPIPSLISIRQYGALLVSLGWEAEQGGRLPEAVSHYWTVAHFGERMQLSGRSLIERLIGQNLQNMAYARLAPALRQMGRADEAALVEYTLRQLQQQRDIAFGKSPLARSSNYTWTALIVHLFAGLVVIFALSTLVTIGYVNTKRWFHPEHRGKIYQYLTVAENYMPVLLFLACLGLYLSYYPYALNFRHYMTAGGEIYDFEPFFYNVFPTFGAVPGSTDLPLRNPLNPYIWYALGGVVLAIILAAWLERDRAAPRV